MERTVVLGVATSTQGAAPAAGALIARYAGLLAAQVPQQRTSEAAPVPASGWRFCFTAHAPVPVLDLPFRNVQRACFCLVNGAPQCRCLRLLPCTHSHTCVTMTC